ncbi:RlpA-like double-psi beta-barrel-protein domain-containing protein-containing protein [Russula brevipes]|nr:RlpA-like double-psi beta-barrel-protein domain-containing protein-containing protein [Russula brevipes]
MQIFATLLLTASLAASALAMPLAVAPGDLSAPKSAAPSYLSGTQVGEGTWYSPGLGACGTTNSGSDYIAAVSQALYDSYPGYAGGDPNKDPVCGAHIRANYQGHSVTVTVVDRCAACQETDLDFSPAAFSQLANQSVGRLSDMTWSWA